jgi:hypothetical protein
LRNWSKALVGIASEVGVISYVPIVGSLELCRASRSAVKAQGRPGAAGPRPTSQDFGSVAAVEPSPG